MQVATDRFLAEIRRSHRVLSFVDVISPTKEVRRLTATGGDVTEDITAEVRRRCSVTCVDVKGDLTPRGAADLLTPYGTEIRPYRGVVYSDGTTEVMPLGVFRISQVDVDDSVGGSPDIKVEGYDRSRTVQRDKFTEPYTVAKDTNVIEAIKAIIKRTFVDAEYDSITTETKTTAPMVFEADSDPWEACATLAKSVGCEVYFDAMGRVVIAPPVDINAMPAPAFTYIEGRGCTMMNLQTKFTDDPGYNGVVLTGESVGDEEEPVRVVVWDDEPTSPTYHLGPYGEVPEFVTDSVVKTEAEATTAAKSILQGHLGFSEQVEITTWPNPALSAGDVVQVERERSGATGLYSLDAITTPLSAAEAGTVLARRRRAST